MPTRQPTVQGSATTMTPTGAGTPRQVKERKSLEEVRAQLDRDVDRYLREEQTKKTEVKKNRRHKKTWMKPTRDQEDVGLI